MHEGHRGVVVQLRVLVLDANFYIVVPVCGHFADGLQVQSLILSSVFLAAVHSVMFFDITFLLLLVG